MTGAIELQPDDGPRLSLDIGPGSDDVVGSHRSSLGDSSKELGSLLRTHWEIAGRRPEDSPPECRRLPDLQEYFRRLTHPKWTSKPPIPRCSGG
ncbi:hypothetical protein GW17_00060744 [Ensete ventricosum]|nr:hypothetical protein GW17_00060744 [Ensete ventricosum]